MFSPRYYYSYKVAFSSLSVVGDVQAKEWMLGAG
jgi:hypothetical protein